MAYTVHNPFQKMIIHLSSNITTSLSLSFTRNGVLQSSKTSTINDGVHTWTLPLKIYSVGDVLDDFKVTLSNKYLWQLDEGITILLNGEEYGTTRTNTFDIKFDKSGKYTLEAVYKGNDMVGMATTGVKTFQVTDPPNSSDSQVHTGVYLLEFVNKNLKTLTYNDNTKIEFLLTQGKTPVKAKTIEKVTPTKILSSDTNAKGKVSFINNGYNAGTYKIGAYMYDYQDKTDKKIVNSVYKTITIKKADPKITYSTATVKKGQKVGIYFRDNAGNRLTNEKVPIYINGKLYNKKTNANGNIWIKMTNTGTFKFKVAYKGNKNLNKKTVTFTKKVKK